MKVDLFDEIYSCYFSTVYHILKEAANKELSDAELRELILEKADRYGFPSITNFIVGSAINAGKIEDAIDDKDAWPFFDKIKKKTYISGKDEKKVFNKSRLKNISDIPLSKYEKMWLRSIYSDPRIKLFLRDDVLPPDLQDVEPLFDWNDFVLFDKYSDGDPYQEEHYIRMFKTILNGVHNHSHLKIKFKRSNNSIEFEQDGTCERASNQEIGTLYIGPDYMEYSERDDKFRLVGTNPKFGRNVVNIATIISCEEVEFSECKDFQAYDSNESFIKKAVFELTDDKNTLERFLMNFSHYEKEAEHLNDRKLYRISVSYDEADEKDVVIRVLSFGPYVKAVEPEDFVDLIAKRLQTQMNLVNIDGKTR